MKHLHYDTLDFVTGGLSVGAMHKYSKPNGIATPPSSGVTAEELLGTGPVLQPVASRHGMGNGRTTKVKTQSSPRRSIPHNRPKR